MKRLLIVLLVWSIAATCYGWSTNDYTNEDKAIVDDAMTKTIYDTDGNGVVDTVDTGGTGTGDVVGPASATDGNLAVFDGVTGKLIKDGGSPFTGLDVPGAETDPVFSAWYATFDPFETGDETDPVFGAWLIATPPLYVEADPAVGTHESTYDHTLIATALQAETDPDFNAWLLATPPIYSETDPVFASWDKSTGISITESQISDFGTYLTAESDPTVDTSAEIQAIIGAGVYQPAGSYLTSLSGAVLTDQTTPQTIGATGARLAMCWATDLTVTNAINGSVTGNAGTVTNGVYTTGAGTVFLSPTGDGSGLTGVLKTEVDGSTTNEINTITGDNAATTSGLAITVAGAGTVATSVSGDTVTITGTGDGTGTDDQTASEVSTTTTNFGGILTNDANSDTVQKCLDKIDDHNHSGVYQPADTDLDDLADGTLTGTKVDQASDTVRGTVEIATSAETTTGTDSGRAVSPDGLAGSDFGKRIVTIKLQDDSTSPTVVDGVFTFVVPSILNGMNLVAVSAGVTTVSSSGLPEWDLYNVTDSHDMLSTDLTVDASEYTSATATTAAVINASYDDVATGDRIRIDCDVAGTGTKGAQIDLVFQLP